MSNWYRIEFRFLTPPGDRLDALNEVLGRVGMPTLEPDGCEVMQSDLGVPVDLVADFAAWLGFPCRAREGRDREGSVDAPLGPMGEWYVGGTRHPRHHNVRYSDSVHRMVTEAVCVGLLDPLTGDLEAARGMLPGMLCSPPYLEPLRQWILAVREGEDSPCPMTYAEAEAVPWAAWDAYGHTWLQRAYLLAGMLLGEAIVTGRGVPGAMQKYHKSIVATLQRVVEVGW